MDLELRLGVKGLTEEEEGIPDRGHGSASACKAPTAWRGRVDASVSVGAVTDGA